MATKLSSIKHRKSWLSIVGGRPTNDMSRHVVQCKQSASLSALVMLCASVTTLATQMWRGRGAATNRATIPARWPAMPHRAIKAARWRQSVCARAVARTHAAPHSAHTALALLLLTLKCCDFATCAYAQLRFMPTLVTRVVKPSQIWHDRAASASSARSRIELNQLSGFINLFFIRHYRLICPLSIETIFNALPAQE